MLHGLLSGSDKKHKHQTHHNLLTKSHRSRSLGERRGIINPVHVSARNYATPTGVFGLISYFRLSFAFFTPMLHKR